MVSLYQVKFKDLFHFVNDYVRIFVVGLLQNIFIFLWALLLIVPGIIKAYAYTLIPLLFGSGELKTKQYRQEHPDRNVFRDK